MVGVQTDTDTDVMDLEQNERKKRWSRENEDDESVMGGS